jgi:hypothetical protein
MLRLTGIVHVARFGFNRLAVALGLRWSRDFLILMIAGFSAIIVLLSRKRYGFMYLP